MFHFTSLRLYSRYLPVTDPALSRRRRDFHRSITAKSGLGAFDEISPRTDVLVILGTSPPTFRSSISTIHQSAVHPSNELLVLYVDHSYTGGRATYQVRTPVCRICRARAKSSHISEGCNQTPSVWKFNTAPNYNRYKVLCVHLGWISSTFSHLPG